MNRKHITIIVQPDARALAHRFRRIYTFSFPKRFLAYLSLGMMLLVLFGAAGGRELRDNIRRHAQLQQLQDELSMLRAVAADVDSIMNEKRIIRDFLGIEALQYEFDINDRMGVGGTWSADDAEEPFDLVAEIEAVEDERPLAVRVHDLRQEMHKLIQVLSKMTETLKCRPTIMPVKEDAIWITSGFGWRTSPFTGLREFHNGLDISSRKGTPIVATADGTVSRVGYNRFIGNYVAIDHDDRFKTSYGHLHRFIVEQRQQVKRGDVIGYMGSTGMSTGYHLHYEVIDNGKKVNPYNFILNRKEMLLASSR